MTPPEPTPSSCSPSGSPHASRARSASWHGASTRRLGEVSIDASVGLLAEPGGGFKLAVELDVTLPRVGDPETAAALVTAAHQVCPYSNATRGNIDVKLTANGREV